MKAPIQILLLSIFLALGGRLAQQEWQYAQNAKLSNDLCGIVGNYLEVGSLREAFEGMSQALVKSGQQKACVGIIDNGRSYAPDCMDASASYQTTVCKVVGNTGVRAEIRYPISSLFNEELFWLTLGIGLALTLLGYGLREFAALLSKKVASEIEERLSAGAPPDSSPDLIATGLDWLFDRTGVSAGIRRKTVDFESQLRKFELRVREESALRARKEAEAEKAAEYIEKVRQIRHDIRSPLSSLFALKDVVEADELARQTLGSAIMRIEAMVEDINQIEKVEIEPTLTIVEVLAEEAVASHRQKFLQGKGVTLVLAYDEFLSPVMAVPGHFRRILDNLLENAFDAAPTGGKIELRVTKNANECTIAMEDNGAGIRPENLARIFTKGGTFEKVNGQGLGLFHAKQTVEAWRGSIGCTPLAEGTRFTIKLPLAQAGVAFVGLPNSGSIAIIDDDPAISRMLTAAGYEIVHSAVSFVDGQQLFATDVGDCAILVDYRLDGGHLGTELIEGLPDRSQAVLCTADYDVPEVIRKARVLGVKILPKPLCFYAEARIPSHSLLAAR